MDARCTSSKHQVMQHCSSTKAVLAMSGRDSVVLTRPEACGRRGLRSTRQEITRQDITHTKQGESSKHTHVVWHIMELNARTD